MSRLESFGPKEQRNGKKTNPLKAKYQMENVEEISQGKMSLLCRDGVM